MSVVALRLWLSAKLLQENARLMTWTDTELADWQQKHKSGNTNTNLKLTQAAAL